MQPKQCGHDSITIPRFISHCRLQGSRIGQSEPGPKLPAAPPWIYKRGPRSDLSSISLLSSRGWRASVCQSSRRATSTRTSSDSLPMEPLSATCERSRLSHWYSDPISPSLSACVCRGSRRTECSILRPGLWRCGQIGWTARKYFTWIFFFFFWRGEVNGGRWRTIFDDYDNLWNFLKRTFEGMDVFRLEDCCRFLGWKRFD